MVIFALGFFGMGWLMNIDGSPTKIAMIVSLVIVMVASTLPALSGVGKGIKWLSNINMGLSFFMLAFFWSLALRCLLSAPCLSVCGVNCKPADDDPHCLVR
jgi:choline-glycine betaine transporter